jgi:N-methylhydantoinase A/acetone carboxylase beta subunit
MNDIAGHTPRIIGIDAGGTMTDTFLIDERGNFVVGKAQSNPADESLAFINSAADAMRYWGLGIREGFSSLRTGIFSGTAMLNRLLERKGRRVGCIVSGGMEDYLRTERGIQTYLGYTYSDRIHWVTHRHNEPLVPRDRMFGVRGRINLFGQEIIPLYENDVREAVEKLIDAKVDAIVVCLLFSYKNPAHELKVREIAQEILATRPGHAVKLFLSSDLYPMRQDLPRLNSTLMEAYAADPSRDTLQRVQSRIDEAGGKFDLRVMASHGGTISTKARALARTMISGPIGGVIGSRFLGRKLGIKNIACSDIGGTSFDLALITEGEVSIRQNPDVARFLLNMPLVRIDSVGAGTGSFVRVNPVSNRIEIGPDSAGSRIGVCWPESGLDVVSITDCNVVLGYINPDFFLGGEVQLDRERAISAVKAQVADPLGIDVYEAANGVVELFEDKLKNDLLGQILGKGYGPENYTLLSYGGGGPLHVAGYSAGLDFEDILVPAWAPGFSAFGCACGDYEYRADQQVDLRLLPAYPDERRSAVGAEISRVWAMLTAQVLSEFERSGVASSAVRIKTGLRMLYMGQLDDLELESPVETVRSLADLNAIADAFESLYGRIYGLAARTPEAGYVVSSLFVVGVTNIEKPELPVEEEEAAEPADEAFKGVRRIYWHGAWYQARIADLTQVRAGNVIVGPAIVESSSSTMLVPPGRSARLDRHRIFHISIGGQADADRKKFSVLRGAV